MSEKPFSEKLNMTLEEMENEILVMRRLEKYLMNAIGEEQYEFLVRGFASEFAKEKLKTIKEWKKAHQEDDND